MAQAPVPFAVTAGGVPTGAEQAAIGQALARVIDRAGHEAAGRVAAAGPLNDPAAAGATVPAWTRAALTEGTTSVRIAAPNELPS